MILVRVGIVIAQMTPAELTTQTGTEDMDEAFVRLIESR